MSEILLDPKQRIDAVQSRAATAQVRGASGPAAEVRGDPSPTRERSHFETPEVADEGRALGLVKLCLTRPIRSGWVAASTRSIARTKSTQGMRPDRGQSPQRANVSNADPRNSRVPSVARGTTNGHASCTGVSVMARSNSSQALAAVSQPLCPGAILRSTYHIEHLIAVGGMGAVYEARHVRLGRRVAIKVLVADGDWHSGVVTRLRQEAEIVAHMEHPHIVQVVDVDETDEGVPFLVMEYLEGETLATRLEREGPLSIPEALRITSEIASALSQVHARGIVHCDLKPGNIFLVRVEGEPDFVKVFDFGVSRAPEPSDAPTSIVAGTLRYMPPEQSGGNPYLDARVDQFALAAVVYEMLAGRPAFTVGPPPKTMVGLELEAAEDLSKVAPWVPAEFDSVLGRALSREREARFSSVARFAWELTKAAIRAGVDTESEPGSGVRPRSAIVRDGTDGANGTGELVHDTRVELVVPWFDDVN